jgi:hypothetical protein
MKTEARVRLPRGNGLYLSRELNYHEIDLMVTYHYYLVTISPDGRVRCNENLSEYLGLPVDRKLALVVTDRSLAKRPERR